MAKRTSDGQPMVVITGNDEREMLYTETSSVVGVQQMSKMKISDLPIFQLLKAFKLQQYALVSFIMLKM